MSTLHGYSTLALGKALENPDEARKGLSDAIDIVLLGLHARYDGS